MTHDLDPRGTRARMTEMATSMEAAPICPYQLVLPTKIVA